MLLLTTSLACLSLTTLSTYAAAPSVRQAFALIPMQQDVEFDKPDEKRLSDYKIEPENGPNLRAWVVRAPDGTLMRRFADTNADNKIDQWCYFRNGVEVYRDIDGDYNEKADQYRWFGTEGLRWGLDKNEDGRIDSWKWISPEELSAEAIRSVRDVNLERYAALLIQDDELRQLGLSKEFTKQLREQTREAKKAFQEYASKTNQIPKSATWVDFSAPPPGVVAADGEQTTKELIVYENVIAMFETKDKHGQLPIGTMIRVGDGWRLIGLPNVDGAGFFYRVTSPNTLPVARVSNPTNEIVQQLVQELEKLDQRLTEMDSQSASRVHKHRSELLRKLAKESEGESRDMWLSQLVDSVVTVSHDGASVETLENLVQEISAATKNQEIVGQATFSYMTSAYSASLQDPNAKLGKIQDQWMQDLESFAEKFNGTRPAGEAMLQLAISEEFAGQDETAIDWYSRIVRDFPKSEMAEKARGATTRLRSVGKPLALKGDTLNGSDLDMRRFKGRLVALQYWATWCEPCKNDMAQLKKLQREYKQQKFTVVGVNLDDSIDQAQRFVKQTQISWPNLHGDGGLESDLAKEMGIFTLPVMLLIDEQGKVINRQITVAELQSELKTRLSKSPR